MKFKEDIGGKRIKISGLYDLNGEYLIEDTTDLFKGALKLSKKCICSKITHIYIPIIYFGISKDFEPITNFLHQFYYNIQNYIHH